MDDIKKTWHVLKKIVNTNHSTKQCVKEIKINNLLINYQNIIAQKFNEYFVSIGPNLAEKIDLVKDAPGDADSYISGHYKNSIFLTHTSPSEICSIVSWVKSTSSSGYDGMPPSLIKQVYSGIALPLSDIFNKSLTSRIFPDQMKIAKIIPMYKSEDRCSINNYRPISILPFFSTFFERLMYNRLLDYVNANNILYPNQFCFREKHSTYMALLKLIYDISEEIDNKIFSISVFIDLSKAFDTINHEILIKKLNSYEIRGVALEWLKNYLTNRLQYVSINCTDSSFCQLPVVSLKAPFWAPLCSSYMLTILSAYPT